MSDTPSTEPNGSDDTAKATENEFSHYVHLASGEVVKMLEKELPEIGGYLIRDGFAHLVTAIYPKEEATKNE